MKTTVLGMYFTSWPSALRYLLWSAKNPKVEILPSIQEKYKAVLDRTALISVSLSLSHSHTLTCSHMLTHTHTQCPEEGRSAGEAVTVE